ncbi:DUF1700 domain-containing protein [Novosphingobium album (ex Hu et al. 2023)]|uniref:DUF1700 domain-containing protein n=1 Tax=Novosphingobium album (ex Hu et al. 2023) TaxID=2930093 RepID=A0ABT0B4S2_9SPHN|nr:DUF1700 domain-containing protein [Novosphingobium album (ex Hu et al. 2023)]MCJ2179883.1 DUF1700 domain-containing protein [Novosphingobium album (ex Hu et al. 2023)]
MTRNEFIKRLKAGLKGMPQADIDEIAADYEDHFMAGMAEGRSEEEVAAALGNPARLARELRFEAGFRNWESDRSPSSAWAAILAFMGLATIDILILLPIVLPIIGVVFGLFVAVLSCFVAGGFVLIVGPFNGFPGGWLVAILGGLGIMSASVAAGALLTLISIWIINALMWFGRLHYRVIEPAIHSED